MNESKWNLIQSPLNNLVGYTELFNENVVSIHIPN